MCESTTGITTEYALSTVLNNAKVRDYVILAHSLTAGVINHKSFICPRFQPVVFNYGFGLVSTSTGVCSYSVSNINIRAVVGMYNQGEHAFTSGTNLPVIKIDGLYSTQKGDKTTVTVRILKNGMSKNTFAKCSIQGDSSATTVKKNTKLKLTSDPVVTVKAKFKAAPSWLNEGTMFLKANWKSVTHALNIVSAKLLSEITENRANEYSNLLNASMLGEIQGTPALL